MCTRRPHRARGNRGPADARYLSAMGRYVMRRLLQTVVTLLAATLLFHASITALPGDPIRALFGIVRPEPEALAAAYRQFGFDKPYWVQYGNYLWDLLRGDLGHSFPAVGGASLGPPVTAILARALPVSLRMLGAAVAIQLVAGLAAGVAAALHEHSPGSRLIYVSAIGVTSVPIIVVAYVTQTVLGVELGWLPMGGLHQGWVSYVLPTLALAAAATGYVVILTRSELLATLRQSFVRAARARSIPRRRLVGLHALRPALLPVVTYVAGNLGWLVTGLLVVEGVFGIPGLGGTLFTAIQRQDRALLVAIITVVTLAVIVANLAADLLYAVIDPRMHLAEET